MATRALVTDREPDELLKQVQEVVSATDGGVTRRSLRLRRHVLIEVDRS